MRAADLGAALGYPSCCVSEFVSDLAAGRMPFKLRGAVELGTRKVDALDANGECLPYGCGAAGAEIVYVPCSACAA